MRRDRRTPDEVALVSVQETNCLRDGKAADLDSKSERGRTARGWRIKFRSHPRRWREFTVDITNGVTFVNFFGYAAQGNRLYAHLEAELKGALTALEWLQHVRPDTPAEIRFSAASFAVLMGEAECPRLFKQLLGEVRRAYIASADAVTIDRERHALVSKRERLAA